MTAPIASPMNDAAGSPFAGGSLFVGHDVGTQDRPQVCSAPKVTGWVPAVTGVKTGDIRFKLCQGKKASAWLPGKVTNIKGEGKHTQVYLAKLSKPEAASIACAFNKEDYGLWPKSARPVLLRKTRTYHQMCAANGDKTGREETEDDATVEEAAQAEAGKATKGKAKADEAGKAEEGKAKPDEAGKAKEGKAKPDEAGKAKQGQAKVKQEIKQEKEDMVIVISRTPSPVNPGGMYAGPIANHDGNPAARKAGRMYAGPIRGEGGGSAAVRQRMYAGPIRGEGGGSAAVRQMQYAGAITSVSGKSKLDEVGLAAKLAKTALAEAEADPRKSPLAANTGPTPKYEDVQTGAASAPKSKMAKFATASLAGVTTARAGVALGLQATAGAVGGIARACVWTGELLQAARAYVKPPQPPQPPAPLNPDDLAEAGQLPLPAGAAPTAWGISHAVLLATGPPAPDATKPATLASTEAPTQNSSGAGWGT